jgi:hypothetical protein
MQQFRPLPRFDVLEDAEPVEMPTTPTTDAMPTFSDPRLRAVHPKPEFPIPSFPAPTSTDPRLRATSASPAITDPRLPAAQSESAQTAQNTVRLPIIVLSGPGSPVDTGQLATMLEKKLVTGQPLSLTTALQESISKKLGTTGETSRLVVIPGKRTRKKSGQVRHLNPRLRQGVILLATLVILFCTLTTLVPLSDSQNGANIFANIGGWLHSAQLDWDIQAHQNSDNFPTALNGPGLPYMAIANSPYVAVAEQAAMAAGIPYVYFVRQIQQESGFNPNAVSVTNAEGIAQFEPYTAAGLGINPWNPNDALRGAARLMAGYYHQYGNYAKALGAYNAGPGAVQGAVYSCGMYWLSCMPAQTKDYVYRIMGV